MNIVHVTHEAVHKIGGIGAVLDGLITAHEYRERVTRTILVGPLFSRRGGLESRLGAGGVVLYSSIDGKCDYPAAAELRAIQEKYGVEIVYGRRPLTSPDTGERIDTEVLLVDVHHIHQVALGIVKFRLFEAYGIPSDMHESVWDFEQYVRLAGPAVEGLKAVGLTSENVVVSHEYMGMPTALLAMLEPGDRFRAVFHAHETATVRRIVEDHPGQDITFYNVMRCGRRDGKYLADYFGSQDGYYKHVLVDAARHCQGVLAVGPEVINELQFLSPEFSRASISLCYNGAPAREATVEEVSASSLRLKTYCRNILGWSPDYVFTHVTRLVRSKGLWRDLMVMEHVEEALRAEGKTAVLIVLSTETGGPRHREEIERMERAYRWPVAHREGFPDLTHGEAAYYSLVQEFNARARNCRVLLVNQFGFDRETCGERMPQEMEFWDIRRGSDVEFGQSIYEPFGIAQIEPLTFGAICVFSSVCGCVGFVEAAARGGRMDTVIVPNYTAVPADDFDMAALLGMTAEQRNRHERVVAAGVGAELARRLPRTATDKARAIERGAALARRMSWDVVAKDYFLPAIEGALRSGLVVRQV